MEVVLGHVDRRPPTAAAAAAAACPSGEAPASPITSPAIAAVGGRGGPLETDLTGAFPL